MEYSTRVRFVCAWGVAARRCIRVRTPRRKNRLPSFVIFIVLSTHQGRQKLLPLDFPSSSETPIVELPLRFSVATRTLTPSPSPVDRVTQNQIRSLRRGEPRRCRGRGARRADTSQHAAAWRDGGPVFGLEGGKGPSRRMLVSSPASLLPLSCLSPVSVSLSLSLCASVALSILIVTFGLSVSRSCRNEVRVLDCAWIASIFVHTSAQAGRCIKRTTVSPPKKTSHKTTKVSLEAALKTSKEAAAAATAAAELRTELAVRPTVSEVKALRQQLRVLQQLEFNAGNDDDDEVSYVCFFFFLCAAPCLLCFACWSENLQTMGSALFTNLAHVQAWNRMEPSVRVLSQRCVSFLWLRTTVFPRRFCPHPVVKSSSGENSSRQRPHYTSPLNRPYRQQRQSDYEREENE